MSRSLQFFFVVIFTAFLVCTVPGCFISSGGDTGAPEGASCTCRLEHVAINVPDPVAMVKWYCTHLNMKIIRKGPPPVNMHFISDEGGNMMLEIYHNRDATVPDYHNMDSLSLHIAFMVDDVKATRDALHAAGATPEGGIQVTDKGDEIAMLRDPWGVPIQFVKRADPMYP